MDATTISTAPATYRITVIFKGDKSRGKGTPPRPWRKHGLTFDQAMEIKDEFHGAPDEPDHQLLHDS